MLGTHYTHPIKDPLYLCHDFPGLFELYDTVALFVIWDHSIEVPIEGSAVYLSEHAYHFTILWASLEAPDSIE